VATYPVLSHLDIVGSIHRSKANPGSYVCSHQYLDGRDQRGIDVSRRIVPWGIIIIRNLTYSVDHIDYFRR
jgi:hypothetical protein